MDTATLDGCFAASFYNPDKASCISILSGIYDDIAFYLCIFHISRDLRIPEKNTCRPVLTFDMDLSGNLYIRYCDGCLIQRLRIRKQSRCVILVRNRRDILNIQIMKFHSPCTDIPEQCTSAAIRSLYVKIQKRMNLVVKLSFSRKVGNSLILIALVKIQNPLELVITAGFSSIRVDNDVFSFPILISCFLALSHLVFEHSPVNVFAKVSRIKIDLDISIAIFLESMARVHVQILQVPAIQDLGCPCFLLNIILCLVTEETIRPRLLRNIFFINIFLQLIFRKFPFPCRSEYFDILTRNQNRADNAKMSLRSRDIIQVNPVRHTIRRSTGRARGFACARHADIC